MEQRMTVCNMSIEGGARAGMVAPDDTTFQYMHGRTYAPKDAAWLSVRIALFSTAFALLLGTGMAFAFARYRFFGREALNFVVTLPIILPGARKS